MANQRERHLRTDTSANKVFQTEAEIWVFCIIIVRKIGFFFTCELCEVNTWVPRENIKSKNTTLLLMSLY